MISVNTSCKIRKPEHSQTETRPPQVPSLYGSLAEDQVPVRARAWTGTVAVLVAAAPEKVAARSKSFSDSLPAVRPRATPTAAIARAVTRWILTRPDALPEGDRLHLKAALANCPELTALAERRPLLRPHAHPPARRPTPRMDRSSQRHHRTAQPPPLRSAPPARPRRRPPPASPSPGTPASGAPCQPDQDAQAPVVRPHRIRAPTQTGSIGVTERHRTTRSGPEPLHPHHHGPEPKSPARPADVCGYELDGPPPGGRRAVPGGAEVGIRSVFAIRTVDSLPSLDSGSNGTQVCTCSRSGVLRPRLEDDGPRYRRTGRWSSSFRCR